MKRTLFSRKFKQTFLAVPAAAMMLGVSQAQTSIGINFTGGAYASYGGPTNSIANAQYYSGFPVTATAFGLAPANWSSTTGSTFGFPYYSAASGSVIAGPASSLTVNWTSPDCWGTHIGLAAGLTNSAGQFVPPPGNDEVTWGFLDQGSAWSVSMSGLNATFPNGYVIQCIAASGDTGTKVTSSSRVTDGTTFTNSFQITSVQDNFGLVGLMVSTPKLTSDTITLSPSGATPSLAGLIITDKPVVSQNQASVMVNQSSPLILSATGLGILPVTYQWQHAGTNVPGATSVSYTNLVAAPADSGSWVLTATNAYGFGISDPVIVSVAQIPSITTDLSSATNIAYAGVYKVLTVAAGGAIPLSYQWKINGSAVAGATNSSFTASNLVTGISGYSVVITNLYGMAASATNYVSVVAAPDIYTPTMGQDAPVSYWPLNESSGIIALDYSGFGHDGNLSNSITLGVSGPKPPTFPGFSTGNTAYQFDGATGLINCGTNASLSGTTDFTVEAWIQTTSTTAGEVVCQRDANGYIGAYRCIVNDDGTLTFSLYGTSGYQFDFTSTRTVNDGNWHYVAFVRNGATGIIYVDGANVATASGTTIASLTPSIGTYIGANPRDNNEFFNGSIASVAIYNHALTPGRVVAHYVTASGVPMVVSIVPGGVIKDTKPVGTPYNGANRGTTWLASSTGTNIITLEPGVTRLGVEQFVQTNSSQITIAPNSDFNTATNGTICFWMQYALPLDTGTFPGPGTEAAMLFDRRSNTPGSQGTVITMTSAGKVMFQSTGGARFTGNGTIDDGLWHQVAVTYGQTTNDTVSIYIDGALDASLVNPGNWSWPTNQEIELGLSHDSYWFIYNGQMDDFRIYNRILTPTEIGTIGTPATSDTLVDTSALKVRFNFDASSALFGNSVVWPYGVLQSSPALGAAAVWTSLTNALSPQPFTPSAPSTFFRLISTP